MSEQTSAGVQRDLVDVTPLREAYLASGERPTDVARRLGWVSTRRSPHGEPWGSEVERALGLRPRSDAGRYVMRRISYQRAVLIAEAIGVDPVELGL